MSEEIRTHDEVARWLPGHVRDDIASTTPCADGGTHDWDHRRDEVTRWGQVEPVLIFEHWVCHNCGVRVQHKPTGANR